MENPQLTRIENELHAIARAVGRIEGKVDTELPRLAKFTRSNERRIGVLENTRSRIYGAVVLLAALVGIAVQAVVSWIR